MIMEKYILDANLFFNMGAGLGLGNKTDEVMKNLTSYAKKLKGTVEFYMPPRVIDEFLSFFEDKNQLIIKNLLASLIIKSPDVGKANVPTQIFYQLVDDIRQRSGRGLNIGEEEIIKAGQLMLTKKELNKKQFQIEIGSVVKGFRDRYRHATRFGFLDSLADLDLIILAKEIDGFLISSDEGVVYWGRVFGIKEMPPALLRKRLDDLVLLDRRE